MAKSPASPAHHQPVKAHLARGRLARQRGNTAEAIRCYREAIRLQPDCIPAYNNLANALQAQGDLDGALAAVRQAIELEPQRAVLHCTLGSLLWLQGQAEAAISAYERAIALQPEMFLAHHNLAKALTAQGNLAQALPAYQQAIRLQPSTPELQFECGNLYQCYGCMQEAIACYKAEIRNQPQSAAAYNSLGAALQHWGELTLSETAYRRALKLKADFDLPHFNLGQVLEAKQQLAAAQRHYEQALALRPDNLRVLYHLTNNRQKQADWADYTARMAELSARTDAHLQQDTAEALPAMMTLSVPLSMAQRKAVAEQLARHHAKAAEALPEPLSAPFPAAAEPNPPRLRIGYVSPDFRTHAVGSLVCQLFQHHQRPEFEIFAYSLVPVDDELTQIIRQGCDHFINLSYQPPLAMAQRIQADGIHILIDLAGYTTHSCTDLFAFKPAPLQLQFLGYPGTMGAEFIPYLIADAQLIPEHLAQHYSEEIIYLPHAWVASPQPIAPCQAKRSDYGLPEEATVYCCFNGTYKITPELFALWMHILQRVPGSVLWLQDSGETVTQGLRQQASAARIQPERVVFAERVPHAEYLARYRHADLFLDTFIYNSGSTAVAALWAGLPLLTCPGESYASRMGASLCHAVGLPELVCDSAQAYEERAVELGTHPEQLAQLKAKLAGLLPDSPLFQPHTFARELEQALRALWQKQHPQREPQQAAPS